MLTYLSIPVPEQHEERSKQATYLTKSTQAGRLCRDPGSSTRLLPTKLGATQEEPS